MTVGCSDLRCWIELLGRASEIAGLLAAGWWFLYTTQFKPRIQFDLGCEIKRLGADTYLIEVLFMCENKGFVEHRIYDLSLSVQGTTADSIDKARTEHGSHIFSRQLFPKTTIVPQKYGWYFVRPGVRQLITHQLVLESPGPFIEVTAGFTYRKRSAWPHTARRVFAVGTSASAPVGTHAAPGDPIAGVVS